MISQQTFTFKRRAELFGGFQKSFKHGRKSEKMIVIEIIKVFSFSVWIDNYVLSLKGESILIERGKKKTA